MDQRVQHYEEKYGCIYDLVVHRTTTDEAFVKQLEADSEKQMWEGDQLSWEFDVEELREWRRHLQKLLTG